ncbi:MAG: hypothetical protein IPJ01_10885 [Micavibrio sp.]|nr:hypothetical protein [Micavibrio sp.]
MTDFAKQLGNESEEIITEKTINVQTTSLIDNADIDIQVRTARAYPRNLKKALENILFLATQDKETADNCFYSVKRDGKTIRGASIRLAEIITSCYGNIRASSRIVSNDGKMVTAQGMCWDLENNVAFSVEVKRRITDKYGRVFSDDLVVITNNACASIALRNAIFKVVPQAVTSRVQTEIKKIVLGEAKDFDTTRKTAIEYFVNLGVTEKNILDLFAKKTIQDLDRDDIFDLRGIATAINEGDTTLESAFMVAPKTPTALGKASRILGTQVEQGEGEYEKTSDIQSNLPKVEETEKVEIKPNEDFLKGEKEIVFGENTEVKGDASFAPSLNVELPITEEKKTEVKKPTKKPKKDYKIEITSVTDDKGNEVSPSMYGGIKQEDLVKPADTEEKKTEEPIVEEKSIETTEVAEVIGTNNEEGKVLTIEPLPVTDIAVDTPVITEKEPPKEVKEKKKYKKFPKKGDGNLFNQES